MPQGEYLQYGGQAIIEGVMMRSPRYFAVACKAPNKEIVLRTEAIEKTWIGRQRWLKRPFLRGTLALLDALALGLKAMKFASNIQLDAQYLPEGGVPIEVPRKSTRLAGVILQALFALGVLVGGVLLFDHYNQNSRPVFLGLESKHLGWLFLTVLGLASLSLLSSTLAKARLVGLSDEDWLAEQKPEQAPSARVQDFAVGATIVVSLLMGLAIFQYTPNLISQNLQKVGWGGTAINFATEIIKIVFFLGYIWAIGQMKEIQEVFKYHGAEHKAINTMEAEQELTIENCRAQTRLHPRCGTSFAIVVLLVGLVIFTFVPRYPLGADHGVIVNASVRFLMELMILPVIAGLSYELIRLAGRFKNQSFVQSLFWPGLMTQYLTTREPEDEQIEVALRALQAVVDAEKADEAAGKEEPEEEAAAQIA